MADRQSASGITFDLSRIDHVAGQVIAQAADRKIWLFHGEPGAGKTTLITQIVGKLGGNPAVVNSPTFTIMNRYETNSGSIFHFDLYRTRSVAEILDFGMDEYLDSGELCFIEWPEKLLQLKPLNTFDVRLTHLTPEKRLLEFF